ncbi:MAG TPA: isoamylase early set domain-containing protein [Gemmatimonadales bacterium]|jgi:hypothetical protein
MMDTFDDRLDEAARALAERMPELDSALDDRVMSTIKQLPVAAVATVVYGNKPTGILGWWTKPKQIRPIWIAAAMAAMLAIVVLFPRANKPGTTAATAATDTVYVHFSLTAPAARAVSVAGSFNGWSTASLPLRRASDGSWEATVPLPVGEHRYEFVVDGQRWIPDPSAQSQADDGFGGTNSVIVVGPKGVVRS